jgi:hypothetical protein
MLANATDNAEADSDETLAPSVKDSCAALTTDDRFRTSSRNEPITAEKELDEPFDTSDNDVVIDREDTARFATERSEALKTADDPADENDKLSLESTTLLDDDSKDIDVFTTVTFDKSPSPMMSERELSTDRSELKETFGPETNRGTAIDNALELFH